MRKCAIGTPTLRSGGLVFCILFPLVPPACLPAVSGVLRASLTPRVPTENKTAQAANWEMVRISVPIFLSREGLDNC